jgi:hypothetical protein
MGLGLGAIGIGRLAYARRTAPGGARLAAAAAIAVGTIAVVLGAARVAMTLAAIRHIERLL